MSQKKKLNVAILGAGAVTPHHINALRQIDDAEVTYVCRRDESKIKEFADEFDLKWTTDYKELLANPDIDVIDITLPSGLHAKYGIAAAKAGKHVVVEKPIDVNLENTDLLIQTCKEENVTLGVISQYRFLDSSLKMYDYVKNGKLGNIIQGDAYVKWFRSQEYYDSGAWRGTYSLDGGGCFINQAIHFIDLLLSVMGPVKELIAKTRTAAHNIEVEDMGMAMLEFQSGAFGIIQASTSFYPGLPAKLDIHGTKGTISLEGEKLALIHVEGEEPIKAGNIIAAGAANPMSIDVTPFVREFHDIISAIKDQREPVVNGMQARQALELILAIYESSRTGKPVRFKS